jgi:hypothetical protein
MSIRKTVSGSLVDQVQRGEDPGPPPEPDDGDVATPKSEAPTEDDKPLEQSRIKRANC